MNIIQSVTRLAQMHEVATGELKKQQTEWERSKEVMDQMFYFAETQLDQFKAGLDDLAVTLGIIEPAPMPMLPPRTPTGPQDVTDNPGTEYLP